MSVLARQSGRIQEGQLLEENERIQEGRLLKENERYRILKKYGIFYFQYRLPSGRWTSEYGPCRTYDEADLRARMSVLYMTDLAP